MIERRRFVVVGEDQIHCESCESRISKVLSRLPGVRTVEASHRRQEVQVEFDPRKISLEAIGERLRELGYEVEVQET